MSEEPSVFRGVSSSRRQRNYRVTLRAGREVRWVMVRTTESILTGRPAMIRVR